MEKKIFLLLLIFISTVLSAIAQEYYPGSSAFTKKKSSRRNEDDEVSSDYDAEHTDNSDDEFPAAFSSRRNRYHGHGSTLNGAKTRSRLASIYDDDDVSHSPWSKPNGFGLDLSSIIPGLQINMPGHHDNAQTCHSILDHQYPMFSDICGVMPQARYSLPNFFGHVEKWQIVQSLAVVLGPSAASQMADPACNRALRLLVCPLLFPPCKPKRDVVSMLPCQSFCQGVKAQCPGASIEHLPCEYLAPTSDICPVNPLPYTSLMNSFASPFPFGGPQLSNLVPPSPLASFLTQQQLPTASIFGQGPLPAPQLFGQSPLPSSIPSFSSPLSQHSVFGQSSPGSTVPAPTLQSLLQMQGNNLQTQGLSSQSLPSLLQQAGIYGSPMIQPQYPQQYPQQPQQQQHHQYQQQQQQQQQHQYQQQQQQQQRSPTTQQYNIQSPSMKSFDATKFISESLSPVIVDVPELGPISDLRKPTTSKIFPALRSANEKI